MVGGAPWWVGSDVKSALLMERPTMERKVPNQKDQISEKPCAPW